MEINLKNNLITDIIFAGISGVILLGFNFLNSREEIISLREILPYYLSGCFTGLVFSSFTTTITNLLYKEKRNSIRDFLPYL